MWNKKAATPLHALHFGFGIGAILAPFIARPFISQHSYYEETGNFTNRDTSGTIHVTNSTENTTSVDSYSPYIYVPYTISCGITLLFTAIFLLFYFYEKMSGIRFTGETAEDENVSLNKPEVEDHGMKIELSPVSKDLEAKEPPQKTGNELVSKPNETKKSGFCSKMAELFSPGTCAGGNTIFGIKMFVLTFLYYVNIVGGERAYGKFIFSYAISCNSGFSTDQATFVNSLFWMFFTTGRGLAIILSKFIKPTILVSAELFLNIVTCVILCIWGYDVRIVLYIFSATIGLVLSPIFPGGMAFLNNYIRFKGMAVSIVFTGGAAGGMIYQWFTGLFFDVFGPMSLMFVMLAYSLIISAIFLLMICATYGRKDRFHLGY